MFNSGLLRIFIIISLVEKEVHSFRNESNLIQDLLKDYDTLTRPVNTNTSVPLALNMGLGLLQLLDVNEKQQILTSNVWLYLHWNDTKLSWDPNEYDNISSIRIPEDQMWKPDYQLFNTASETASRLENQKNVIYDSGYVVHVRALILKSTCKMDVTWFPFDEQKCDIKFGTWTHSGWEIDMQLGIFNDMSSVELGSYVDNGEWLLLGVEPKRTIIYYPCCPQPYINIVFTIHIRRRSFYYFFNLIVPCALIGFLALLGFTLPPDSGEKLSLGVTVLFSLIVFLNMISGSMPANSDAVPLIGMYFNVVMFMIASSVVSTIVINLHLRSSYTKEIGGRTKKLFFYSLPRILRLKLPLQLEERHSAGLNVVAGKDGNFKQNEDIFKSQDVENLGQRHFLDRSQKETEERIKMQWKFVALVVDKICFIGSILFAVTAAFVFLVSALCK